MNFLMINLNSLVDGFAVIIGSYLMNAIMFLTLLFAVRVPDFDDDRNAVKPYLLVVFLHFALSVLRYHNLYYSNVSFILISVAMFAVVGTIVYLSSHWIYTSELDPAALTNEQCQFYVWTFIEVFYFMSTVFAAFLFILISVFGRMQVDVSTPTVPEKGEGEFIVMQSFMIQLFSQIVSVPFINFVLTSNVSPSLNCQPREAHSFLHPIAYLAFLQVVLFILGFFKTRVSLYRATWYNNIMPELCHYSIFVALLVLPVVNIALSIAYVC